MPFEELMQLRLATVTTASRSTESEIEAPGTVIVISREKIRSRGYVTLVDVLRDLPGMDVTPYYFSEVGTRVGVRGISGNNKIIVLVNGMRVNPPGGEYYPLRTDLAVLGAKQVEVIYGPGSTLYGEDAISAVINIVTESPPEASGELSVAMGTDQAREAWLSFGKTFGDGGGCIYGYAFYNDGDLTRIDRGYPEWWTEFEEVAGPKGAGDPPRRQDLGFNALVRVETDHSSLQLFHRESRRSSSEGFGPILGFVDEAVWHDRSTVVEGRNSLPLSDRASLESSLVFNRFEIDPRSRYVFPAGNTAWFLNDYKYGRGMGATLDEVVRIEVTERWRVLAGVMASSHEITPKATVPGGADPSGDVATQAGSFVYYAEQGSPATRHEIPRAVTSFYETYATYMESAYQVSERLKAIVGLRLTSDTRFDNKPLTPRGALVYSVTDNLTAKYAATKAYVAPAPYFAHAPFDNGTRLATSNPDLEPEEAVAHEVILRYARENVQLGLSVYYSEQHNLLIVADAPVEQNVVMDTVYMEDGSTRTLSQTVNGGDSRSAGCDLYGELDLGRVMPWFSLSYVDYEEATDGVVMGLRGLSEYSGRLGATWSATRKLLVTPSLVARSKPENVIAGALDEELNRPWEANLHVLYQVSPSISMFARAANVTNNRYALGSFTGTAVPQETFHAVVGAKVRL